MLLREIMTESVVTASPATPVRGVAELMRDRNVGSVVLADDAGRPVGMITDRDVAVTVVAGSGGAGVAGGQAGPAAAAGRRVGMITDRAVPVTVVAGSGAAGVAADQCATTPVVTGEPDME